MNNEQYQQLKDIVIEANSEIMEPELRKGFSCLASYRGERFVCSYDVAIHDDEYDILEIIGRPIRLADVLLAIEQLPFFNLLVTKTDNNLTAVERLLGGSIFNGYWNLRDDNLDNQSDECKEFLYKLLVKETK